VTPVAAIAQSGLAAATLRLNVSASNVANMDDESPVGSTSGYQRGGVTTSPTPGGGVTAQAVTLSPAQILAYDPTASIADEQGLVQRPDIDPIAEVSNQMAANHAFAFSLDALKAADKEQKALLDLKT
jgi:flagellar basal-body rod protein FlgC